MAFLSSLGQAAPGGVSTDFGSTVNAARSNYDAATGRQNTLLDQLNQVVSGQTPSLAEQQLKNTTQANANAAAGAIASQQGINPGLAARQINQQAASLNQQEAGQAAVNRIAEQMSARNLIAQILQGQTGTDTGLYGTAAGAQLQNQQLNEDAYKTNLQSATNLIGSLLSAGGTLGAAAMGIPPGMGKLPVPQLSPAAQAPVGAPSIYGNGPGQVNSVTTYQGLPPGQQGPPAPTTTRLAHGGEVSSRDEFLDAYANAHPEMQAAMLKAWHAGKEHAMKAGGEVEGPPAPHPGDDERNDLLPRLLSQGEVVLPRTVAHSPELAARFVERNNQVQRAKGVMHRPPAELFGRRA